MLINFLLLELHDFGFHPLTMISSIFHRNIISYDFDIFVSWAKINNISFVYIIVFSLSRSLKPLLNDLLFCFKLEVEIKSKVLTFKM